MIELDGVTKTYGKRPVVDQVSFSVAQGEFCAVVGPSGSGKSTTLRLINRLLDLSAGTIRVAGADITTLPPVILRRRIGYAIQSVGLFPHWTIADNIATVPRLLEWPEARIQARIDELLNLVRLDAGTTRNKFPHQLSGGQQQRVGVARALAADPELLLMDEPFGALDPITRQALRGELARIHRATGKTILFVTHDIDEALALADKIAVLHGGALLQFGTPAEILTLPANAFIRDFIGGTTLGLKRLAQRRVGELMRHDPIPDGESISDQSPLTEAVSMMVLRQTDQLPVRDAEGNIAGAITFRDMVAR
jgi:osmoprotectant transport system ATP-binding protein